MSSFQISDLPYDLSFIYAAVHGGPADTQQQQQATPESTIFWGSPSVSPPGDIFTAPSQYVAPEDIFPIPTPLEPQSSSSGSGKRRRSPSQESANETGQPVPKKRYQSRVGVKLPNLSCAKCKKDKKKCIPMEDRTDCKHCYEKGHACVRDNIDGRRKRSLKSPEGTETAPAQSLAPVPATPAPAPTPASALASAPVLGQVPDFPPYFDPNPFDWSRQDQVLNEEAASNFETEMWACDDFSFDLSGGQETGFDYNV